MSVASDDFDATALAKKLGQRIRALRLGQGLSLAQLAHQSEPQLTRFALSHIERGKRLPSLSVLFGLAERLGLEAFELLLLPGGGRRSTIAEMVRLLPEDRTRALEAALEREPKGSS